MLYIAHNIEYTLYRHQIAKHLSIPLLGRLLANDANKLEGFELGYARRCSGIVTVSTLDEGFFAERFPRLPMITISPSYAYPVSLGRSMCAEPSPLRLAFLRYLQWWPNRRDLTWFLEQVLPKVPDHIHLHVYGKGSEDLGADSRLIGHGYVNDIQVSTRRS